MVTIPIPEINSVKSYKEFGKMIKCYFVCKMYQVLLNKRYKISLYRLRKLNHVCFLCIEKIVIEWYIYLVGMKIN